MALPTASVKVQVKKLIGVPAAALAAGHIRYARAKFKAGGPQLITGRTRPIPDAGGAFDLTAEPSPWIYETRVNSGDSVNIQVDLWEDHGDAAPSGPTAFTVEAIADPWTSGTFTTAKIEYELTTTPINPTDAAFLARAAAAAKISGTIVVSAGLVVEIEEVKGLYKPNFAAVPPAKGSDPAPAGYISQDDLGRVFTNRQPNGNWSKGQQFIEVKAKVTSFGLPFPAAAKVEWTIVDVDDPTNDEPDFHRDGGQYVDANDYTGGTHSGAKGDDNPLAFSPGNGDANKLLGAGVRGNARWATAPGGPAPAASSPTKARTDISKVTATTGTTSVRIHCPNVLGTNFVVKADAVNAPAGFTAHNTATGVMTMWSRIDVEVARMAGAHSVAGAIGKIPPLFRHACVQLDFQTERIVTGALDKAEIAATEADEDVGSARWVDDPGVFTKRGQPGWFFLGSARLASPLPPAGGSSRLFLGTTYTLDKSGTDISVEVPGSFSTAEFVRFRWTAGGLTLNASFHARSKTVAGGKTKIVLGGNDVTPGFTGHNADGSIDFATSTMILFFPQHTWGSAGIVPGGFGVPSAGATVAVHGPGATFTTGISPSVKVSGKEYFAGRTILFTHADSFSNRSVTPPTPLADFNASVISTVVHEFIHAFGMPHKCGNWDWRTPGGAGGGGSEKSCCMNYFNTWILDSAQKVVPGHTDKQGDFMCARHLMEVRRVHIEQNKGLRW